MPGGCISKAQVPLVAPVAKFAVLLLACIWFSCITNILYKWAGLVKVLQHSELVSIEAVIVDCVLNDSRLFIRASCNIEHLCATANTEHNLLKKQLIFGRKHGVNYNFC